METPKTLAPYNVYAEITPNPNTMKFVANRWLITNGKSYEILVSQRVGSSSPLAEKLFNFPFINGVFIASNFITVTKTEAIEWHDVILELRDFITDYLNAENGTIIREEFLNTSEETVVDETSLDNVLKPSEAKNFSAFEQKIVEILDEYIKPAVESDGGAIELDSYNNGVVKVVLKGSCSGCPSSTMTLKAGIEQMLKSMLPEVQSVEAING